MGAGIENIFGRAGCAQEGAAENSAGGGHQARAARSIPGAEFVTRVGVFFLLFWIGLRD